MNSVQRKCQARRKSCKAQSKVLSSSTTKHLRKCRCQSLQSKNIQLTTSMGRRCLFHREPFMDSASGKWYAQSLASLCTGVSAGHKRSFLHVAATAAFLGNLKELHMRMCSRQITNLTCTGQRVSHVFQTCAYNGQVISERTMACFQTGNKEHSMKRISFVNV